MLAASNLRSPPAPSTLNKLEQQVHLKIINNRQMSFFDKLQLYDRLVGQSGVPRTDKKVLKIYEQIFNTHAHGNVRHIDQVKRNKNYSEGFMNSPTVANRLEEDVEDPELFSFSKTRKDSEGRVDEKTVEGTYAGNKYLSKLHKDKFNNSDKPRYLVPSFTEPNEIKRVSEFNEGEKPINKEQRQVTENCELTLHELSSELKKYLRRQNFTYFCSLSRQDIRGRKQLLKQSTSAYVYQMKLLKKSLKAIQLFNQEAQHTIAKFIQHKQQLIYYNYLSAWYRYANRSEAEKQREAQVKTKKLLLVKKLFISRLLRSVYSEQGEEGMEQSETRRRKSIEQAQKKEMICKARQLIKKLAISAIHTRHQKIKQLHANKITIFASIKKSNLQQLLKLTKCLQQVSQTKQNKLAVTTALKTSSLRFMAALKNNYYFQKAYWQSSGSQHPHYQKIVLLYELMDYLQHSTNRQGYNFMQVVGLEGYASLEHYMQGHPAYCQYYRQHKLRKYFTAMRKQLLHEARHKEAAIRYGIVGKRVLREGLLAGYALSLRNQVKKEDLEGKLEDLGGRLRSAWSKDFILCFKAKKQYQQANQIVTKAVKHHAIIRSIMKLKTFSVSKKYYRKIILASKLNKQINTLEAYFLQWKLSHAQSIHNRLLQRDILQLRKKQAIKTLIQRVKQYSLTDRIHRNKQLSLQGNRYRCYGEAFIAQVRRNWLNQQKNYRLSKEKVKERQLQVVAQIQGKMKARFVSEITEYWFQRKLQAELMDRIDREYGRKLMGKGLLGLGAVLRVSKMERQKQEKIQRSHRRRLKTKVMGLMVEKLIQKLLLKRIYTYSKKYWFIQLMSAVHNLPDQPCSTSHA